MTNEKKSREIANNNCSHPCCSHREHYFTSELDCYKAAMEMAAWKDEQFAAEKQALIEKACEWIENLMIAGGYDAIDRDININDFRKAMEETK